MTTEVPCGGVSTLTGIECSAVGVYFNEFERLSKRLGELAKERGHLDAEEKEIGHQLRALAVLLQASGVDPPSTVPQEQGTRPARTSMPPRRDELATIPLSRAVEWIANAEEGRALHADDFARRIWVIETADELRHVKNTLNSELIRAVNRGALARAGKNVFVFVPT